MDEKNLTFLEEAIPELAETALKQAYWQALAEGFSVLQSENDNLVEVRPDGTKTFIKKLCPRVPVKKDKKIDLS